VYAGEPLGISDVQRTGAARSGRTGRRSSPSATGTRSGSTPQNADFEEVTTTASYDFDDADRLDVTVDDPSGLDLAGNARITESGGSVTVDTSGADPGTYRITVEGSEIED